MSPRRCKVLGRLAREEAGTTIAELVVGLATGTVVFAALTTLVIVTLHTSTRVSAQVDATQRARLAITRVTDQLHSACIAPKIPPIRKESTGTSLRFIHATGAAAIPTPTLTVIEFSGTTLTQTDYAYKEGSAPFWVFSSTPSSTRQLMNDLNPITGQPVFSYYSSASGAISPTPLTTPLSETDASRTIYVKVAFKTSPTGSTSGEGTTPAPVQGGATFRLTAPSFNKEAPSMPCQ